MQEENTAPPNPLRQREVLQMVNLSPSLRCLFLIAALLCLPHSTLALPAIEEHFFLICGDVGIVAFKYADPKTAGTPVDFIVLKPGKATEGVQTIRSTKDGIFLGSHLCKQAKMTLCPIEQNPTERTC
jgi:hypothetical protein